VPLSENRGRRLSAARILGTLIALSLASGCLPLALKRPPIGMHLHGEPHHLAVPVCPGERPVRLTLRAKIGDAPQDVLWTGEGFTGLVSDGLAIIYFTDWQHSIGSVDPKREMLIYLDTTAISIADRWVPSQIPYDLDAQREYLISRDGGYNQVSVAELSAVASGLGCPVKS
jgi:hypothetical protein